ncbi:MULTISPECIES: aldo/keto reductase [unclassified Bacillus (in: firmicutes)]|uniref:aldo/keto reductase n=1 Tax=unclassified Bacillus (in: firmicutes) TaxID=185979 RepID=UPI0008EBE4E4|nr:MULTISPECIES: aldo/keto reductase [unclassified Bacillus (in: firmicutes)]SFA78042.1 Predicted oxidoreductase [Bacillus sp. UNCCL13]SFQ67933.1 Predicted oxidoreductase [Bacillus sp. cl95]
MRYKLLGKSGLRVSELALGTMTFGEDWGFGASKEESKKIFDQFVEAGGNFIDTACNYTNGTSEKFIGEFIQGNREQFVIATKYSLSTRRNDPNGGGNHRKNLVQTIEGSLKRLNTDYIDLLWLHAWDFTTPIEEVMRALDDMVRAGKVLYVGISDTPAWIVSQANTLAMLRGWTPFIGLQVEYNLLQRAPERDLLPMARAFDIGVTAWAPMAGGALTGKYLNDQSKEELKRLTPESKRLNDINSKIAMEVVKIAGEIGSTPAQVALNWVRQQSGVMIPIVGARKVSQMTDNLGAVEFKLSSEHLRNLNQVSEIELGFPHEFLSSEPVRNALFGTTFSKIDNHRK